MDTIDLAHVSVTSDLAMQATSSAPRPGTSLAPKVVSLDAARRSISFPLLEPTVMPSPSFQLDRVLQDARGVTLVYTHRTTPTAWLVIKQQPYAGIGRIIVPTSAVRGSIAGRPTAFVTQTIAAQGQPGGKTDILLALFEVGDVLVQLQAPRSSQEILAQVGASLQ